MSRGCLMKIKTIKLRRIRNSLITPFKTSYGVTKARESIIVEINDDQGNTGWGECVAFTEPWYTEETVNTCWHMLADILIPILFKAEKLIHPEELVEIFHLVRKNNMAKAALEGAIWDLYAKRTGISLKQVIGGTRDAIEAGVAIGMKNHDLMMGEISRLLEQGYKRFKVKIMPGDDIELIKRIREHYPDIPLMADANSAYTLKDIDRLKELDQFNLQMIEQPFAVEDFIGHATLQKEIKTPICLDESISSYSDVVLAHQLGSCKIINVKAGRVGGLTEAIRIHDYCVQNGIRLWVGGMLEYGISRAQTIALASLPGFTIPGDISETRRYWKKDITIENVEVNNGLIVVPDQLGIGFNINIKLLERLTIAQQSFSVD